MGDLTSIMIKVRNVTHTYRRHDQRDTPPAIAAMSLCVHRGNFVCLLGPSGCGKSTLLNLIAGFIHPTEGTVLFDGRKVEKPGPDRGVIFQEPALFFWLTVSGNVELGLILAGLSKPERKEIARHALQQVGLHGFETAYPHTLSGGMKQRVSLARVNALQPKALLMDEPFNALDTTSREALQDEVLRLWSQLGQTILFVTHNIEEAAYLADRVIVMGLPPQSLLGELVIDLPRPRIRHSQSLNGIIDQLRIMIDKSEIQ
jgi:NitT/TauT family transport system ATP-binding protein